MSKKRILVIDLPTLRLDWVEKEMPELHALTQGWHRAAIEPVFPGLTCPSQATLTTGASPSRHGIVANAIFDRKTRTPEFWTFTDEALQARRIWEDAHDLGKKSGVFFLLNIREAKVDAAILPKPIHHDDGSMEMWCWHKPEGLYPRLVKSMGHFNLLRFWGPMAGIESSKWIAEAAKRTILEEDLDLAFVYFPHTDYAPQKFGPESEAYRKAHRELDALLSGFIREISAASGELLVAIVSEYAITEVNRCVFPNRVLREAGMLTVIEKDGREFVDYARSPAFAVTDHQIAHVYCGSAQKARIRELFEMEEGIEQIVSNPASCGLGHKRSGELILIARRDAWFAYPWWTELAKAPEWATTIDIHNKPGYDPLEMFWDAAINGTAQDTALIKGSHGAPARNPDQMASLISNLPAAAEARSTAGVYEAIKAALV